MYQFVGHPPIVTAPGRYLTRGGEAVQVDAVLPRGLYVAVGRYSCGTREAWSVCGRVLPFSLSGNDIVSPADPR